MKLVGLLLVVGVVCTVAVDTDTQDKSSNSVARQTQTTRGKISCCIALFFLKRLYFMVDLL